MKRVAVAVSFLALAFPAAAGAATQVHGRTKGRIISAWVNEDLLVVSRAQEQNCFRAQTYRGWAAATVGNPKGGPTIRLPLCDVKVDFGNGPQVWQPDVAMFHRTSRGWRYVWEFDETSAAEAARHGIPRWAFGALVNKQLFV